MGGRICTALGGMLVVLGWVAVAGTAVAQETRPVQGGPVQGDHSVGFVLRGGQGPNFDEARVVVRGPWIRLEFMHDEKGLIGIMNLETGQTLTLEPKEKKAYRMNQVPHPLDLYAWMKGLGKAEGKRIEPKTIDGVEAPGFEVEQPAPALFGAFAAGKRMMFKVWVDPASHRPLRIEGEAPDGKAVAITDIRFDLPEEEVAAARFSLTVPDGYQMHDMGGVLASKLKAPPTTQEAERLLTLRPGVGIGALKFGASRAEVIEAFGEPEAGKGSDMQYPSSGMALLVPGGIGLLNIIAFSGDAWAPFPVNDFVGQTEQGIKMGDNRARIEAVYGPPDKATDQEEGMTQLDYEKQGLWFILHNDRLVRITLFIAPEKLQQRQQAATQPATGEAR